MVSAFSTRRGSVSHSPSRKKNRFKEPPYTEINHLIHNLGEVILAVLTPPYAFYGHSIGGLVSFELARYLRHRHCPVQLFISGYQAPQSPLRFPPVHNFPQSEFLDSLRFFEGTPDEILQNEKLINLIAPMLRSDLRLY